MKVKFLQIFLITFTSIIISGCYSVSGYKKPITDFRNASSVTVNSAKVCLTEMNKVERNIYIDRQTKNREKINLKEVKHHFSDKDIAIRLKALSILSRYAELLEQLVNSDAPEKITCNAESLGVSLSQLSSNLSAMNNKENEKLTNAVAPVTTIVGEIAKLVAKRKIKKALDRAIIQGEKPVTELIEAIRTDVRIAYERKKRELSAKMAVLTSKYNDAQKKAKSGATGAKLEERAEKLKIFLCTWELFQLNKPDDGLKAMDAAHKALVDYVKSDKKELDTAKIIEAMEEFVSTANRIGTAVKQLQNL